MSAEELALMKEIFLELSERIEALEAALTPTLK